MMKSWEYGGAGGHVGRHIGLACDVILSGLNVFLAPKTWGKTPRSSNLS